MLKPPLVAKPVGFDVLPNEQGIEYLDYLLLQPDIQNIGEDTKLPLFGMFLGEAIIATYGGRWVLSMEQEAIEIQEGFVTFPLGYIKRSFEEPCNGRIINYFNSIKSLKK